MNQPATIETLQDLKKRWRETAEGKRLALDLISVIDLEPILNATAFSIELRLDSINELGKKSGDPELASQLAAECNEIRKEARLCYGIGSYLRRQ